MTRDVCKWIKTAVKRKKKRVLTITFHHQEAQLSVLQTKQRLFPRENKTS